MDKKTIKETIKAIEKLIKEYKFPLKKNGKLKIFFNRDECPLCKIFSTYHGYFSFYICNSECPNYPNRKNAKEICGYMGGIQNYMETLNAYNNYNIKNEKSQLILKEVFENRAIALEKFLIKFKEKHGVK